MTSDCGPRLKAFGDRKSKLWIAFGMLSVGLGVLDVMLSRSGLPLYGIF